jgi:hypothetical protein
MVLKKNYFELELGDLVLKMICNDTEQTGLSFIVLTKSIDKAKNDYYVVACYLLYREKAGYLTDVIKLFIDDCDLLEVL